MNNEKLTLDNFHRASFFPRTWFKLRYHFTERVHQYRFPLGKIIGLWLVVLMVLTLVYIVKANEITIPVREPYLHSAADGFSHAKELAKFQTKTFENDRFRIDFDEQTTHFILTNKDNGQVWTSYPNDLDGNGNPVELKEKDILTVFFYQSLGTPSFMGTYKNSVKKDIVNEINKGTNYWFRYNESEKSIEVLYEIGDQGLNSSNFPIQISIERFQTKILANLSPLDQETISDWYLKIKSDKGDFYRLKSPDSLSSYAMKELDRMLKSAGYTEKDLEYDNADQGIATVRKDAYFEVSVKYTLKSDGLEVKLINDAIVEKDVAPLVYIDLLPYFGCSNKTDTGYIAIPDGSGILINHNNGKSYANMYSKRIYGPDMANTKELKPEEVQKISLPMYGYKKNQGGFVAAVENGASMATLFANNPTASMPFNCAYYRFHYREGSNYEFVTWSSNQPITMWTKYYSLEDYTVRYLFDPQPEVDYVGMADLFRNYLLGHGAKEQALSDQLLLNLTLLGGYIYPTTRLGFPVEAVGSLTSYHQAEEIINRLKKDGVANINVLYQGWMNDGIRHTSATSIKNESVVGSRKEMAAFNRFLSDNGMRLYPEVNLSTIYTEKDFNPRKQGIRDMFSNVVRSFQYSPATLSYDFRTTPYYTIKASEYPQMVKKFLKTYSKQEQQRLSIMDLANTLSGSYRNKDTIFRNDTEKATISALQAITGSGIAGLNLHDPNSYAFGYLSNAVDIPVFGTEYQVADAIIPLYQLTVSGLFEYAGISVNLENRHTERYQVLKTIETGSNLHFTWSYEDTLDLTDTEYNNYYSTYYENSYQKAVDIYKEISSLGISGSRLVDHQFYQNNPLLVMVSYENGLAVYINYGNIAADINGEVIGPMDYKVVS